VRVPDGAGQEGGAGSPASGGGGADDPGGVRTLPHEDNQLRGESQSRLRLHQLLSRALWQSPPSDLTSLLRGRGGGGGREATDHSVSDPRGLSPAGKRVVPLHEKVEQWPESRFPPRLRPAGITNTERTFANGQMDRAPRL